MASFDDFIADLSALVAIDSSENNELYPAQLGKPFGANRARVLTEIARIAERLGFAVTFAADGSYAYCDVGDGQELIGVLGHLDVVPAPDVDNWRTNPFALTEVDGVYFGRGVQDDKGPTLAAMYGLAQLLDGGAKLNKRVRFVFAIDEETAWRSIDAYVEREELPTFGFTPDANFPLLYAEKGVLRLDAVAIEASSVEFKGGSVYNAVAAQATTVDDPKLHATLDAIGATYDVADGMLTVAGKTAHAMRPQDGRSAILDLAQALARTADMPASGLLQFLLERCADPSGEAIFGNIEDAQSGHLTLNVGLARFEPGRQFLGLDLRYPVTFSKDDIVDKIRQVAGTFGIIITEAYSLDPIYIELDSEPVQKLLQAYRDVTGDIQSQPQATGGATFARAMPNIVAYGAVMPASSASEHEANEFFSAADYKTAIAIYARAFELLAT